MDDDARLTTTTVPEPTGELEEYRLLCRARLEHLVPVRQPLVLISQVERSGGTLLSASSSTGIRSATHIHRS